LDRPWTTDVVERIETAAWPPLPVSFNICVGIPELRRAQVVDWPAKVRVIQDVEEIAFGIAAKPVL
jgi:hypothetical protein